MTAPIVVTAIVSGSVSFFAAMIFNFYRDSRSRKRSIDESTRIWE
jgi:hypothetical protein